MFKSLTIQDYGPHRRTHIVFGEATTIISGPSETGKSTVLDALATALWGRDTMGNKPPEEIIPDGADALEVALMFSSGAGVERRLERGGKWRNAFVDRELLRYGGLTEKEMKEYLKFFASDKLLRLVMQPFSWVQHAQTNARSFRDLLLEVLPPVSHRDMVRELMGEDWRKSDPHTAKGAERVRADANRVQTEKKGELAGARKALEEFGETPPTGPAAADVEEARATIADERLWQEYVKAVKSSDTANARLAEWKKRRADIPEPPTDDQGRRNDALKEIKRCRAKVDSSRSALTMAQRKVNELLSAPSPPVVYVPPVASDDDCPTCGKAWPERSKKQEAKRAAAIEERQKAEEVHAIKITGYQASRLNAKTGAADALRAHKANQAELDAAVAELEEAQQPPKKQAAIRDRLRSLGNQPTVPVKPTRPEQVRPTAVELQLAQSTLRDAGEAKGAIAEHARQEKRATARVDALQNEHATAVANFNRLDRLTEAVRRAPSIAGERHAAVLGDIGPVKLVWGVYEKEPAVSVLVDNRPWHCASHGRQICADMWLRAGIRRAWASKKDARGKSKRFVRKVPIFVDNAQCWTGEWPTATDMGGPLVRLETHAGDGISAGADGLALLPGD